MKNKIRDRSVSRELLEKVLLILQSEGRVRTKDLQNLKIKDVKDAEGGRSVDGICDIFIAEFEAKKRGSIAFKCDQKMILKEFLETSDAEKALRRRQEILAEKAS